MANPPTMPASIPLAKRAPGFGRRAASDNPIKQPHTSIGACSFTPPAVDVTLMQWHNGAFGPVPLVLEPAAQRSLRPCAASNATIKQCLLLLLARSPTMAWKRRMGGWTACWAGRPPIFPWPPATSPRPGWSPWWATILPQEDTDLLVEHGIDLEGLERVAGKTFFWAGKYTPDMNDRVTLTTELNVFADFQPKLPPRYLSAPYLLLGNIQPRLQREVRGQMQNLKLAGGDTMNFWIKDFREELLATIRDWDFLLINDAEARMLSGHENLKKAARAILDMGPHTLVIKRGEYGAMLFRQDAFFIVPGYLLETVFDPTGAGDCFAGGFIGYLAQQGFDLKSRPHQPGRVEPRGHLRLRHGQLLLRALRRRTFPHPRSITRRATRGIC